MGLMILNVRWLPGDWLRQWLDSIVWHSLRVLSSQFVADIGNVVAKGLLRIEISRLRGDGTAELAGCDCHWPAEGEACGWINFSVSGPSYELGDIVMTARGRLEFLRILKLRRLGVRQGRQCVPQSY